MAGARRRLGEAEFDPRRRRRDLVEDRERGGHDLRPDAVAGQDRDVEAVVGEHAMLGGRVSTKAKPDTATARAASSTIQFCKDPLAKNALNDVLLARA